MTCQNPNIPSGSIIGQAEGKKHCPAPCSATLTVCSPHIQSHAGMSTRWCLIIHASIQMQAGELGHIDILSTVL